MLTIVGTLGHSGSRPKEASALAESVRKSAHLGAFFVSGLAHM